MANVVPLFPGSKKVKRGSKEDSKPQWGVCACGNTFLHSVRYEKEIVTPCCGVLIKCLPT